MCIPHNTYSIVITLRIINVNGNNLIYLLLRYNIITITSIITTKQLSPGATRDIKLKLRTLDWAVKSGDVKKQDLFYPIGAVSGSVEGANLAWKYYQEVCFVGTAVEILTLIYHGQPNHHNRTSTWSKKSSVKLHHRWWTRASSTLSTSSAPARRLTRLSNSSRRIHCHSLRARLVRRLRTCVLAARCCKSSPNLRWWILSIGCRALYTARMTLEEWMFLLGLFAAVRVSCGQFL